MNDLPITTDGFLINAELRARARMTGNVISRVTYCAAAW
jgi:hypothetical protein